jgi:hypothetical protein
MITETATSDNTIPLTLVRAGREIDAGFARAQRGTEDWIEGSLQLAQGLALGRKEFPSDPKSSVHGSRRTTTTTSTSRSGCSDWLGQ